MMNPMKQALARFRGSEDGNASVEFAIIFPVFFVLLMTGIELGLMTLRYAYLERSLDIAVRDVRLSTGEPPTHAELIQTICARASLIDDCSNNLTLEMLPVDPRNWTTLPGTISCTNRAEEVQPVTEFKHGQANQLMIIRACAKFKPLYPSIAFTTALNTDSAGDVPLVATTAFVQEPL